MRSLLALALLTASCTIVQSAPGTPGYVSSGSATLELNVDRPGSDYRSFDLGSTRPEECRDTCMIEPQCVAFTYVNPGVQGPSADQDIVSYCTATSCGLVGPSHGFIDWNGNGVTDSNTAVDVDGNPLGTPNRRLDTTSDWDKLDFNFQCSPAWGAGAPTDNPALGTNEVGLAELEAKHVLHLPRSVNVDRPGSRH